MQLVNLNLGTTINVKAPLEIVIKNILVVDGQSVHKDQVLVELDTTAALARLGPYVLSKNVLLQTYF